MNTAAHTDLSAYAGEDHIAIFNPRHEVIVSLTDHLIIFITDQYTSKYKLFSLTNIEATVYWKRQRRSKHYIKFI